MIEAFTPVAWVAFFVCAACIGLTKTAFPALGALPSAVMAMVMVPRLSIGVVLLLCISADVVAVWLYRHDADVAELRRLVIPVLGGVMMGWGFLMHVSDIVLARVIGIIIAVFTVVDIVRRYRKTRRKTSDKLPVVQACDSDAGDDRRSGMKDGVVPVSGNDSANKAVASSQWLVRLGWGSLGGFTTMVANAGGPVMSLYLMNSRYSIRYFIGTQAWFFAAVNLVKFPFSVSAGAIDTSIVPLAGIGAVIAVIFAFIGKKLVTAIPQRVFDAIILGLTLCSAIILVTK
ncbi:MAG: sulfite exporter TauE/SafE family protein [Actinomycetaceae bacterium]|nr:sulfite exporter TauE/SafE family protein [Actinomycetaceae bacterium]